MPKKKLSAVSVPPPKKRRANTTKTSRPLSPKERLFVAAFYGQAKANATQACILAGYSKGPGASTQGYLLLRRIQVQRALAALMAKREHTLVADAQTRDRILSAILQDASEETQARISAAKELNKCEGRHSLTHIHSGKLTLEQAIAASRRPTESP